MGSAAAGSKTPAAWTHPPTVSLKHVMVHDTRGTKCSSLDDDEVPMKEMFLDNLVPEERKTIILVVCISDKPVKGAPTREEAIGPLTLFHRKERCPGNTTRRYEAEKGFLCVTFALPERREGGDADTLPLIRVYATTRPCTMGAILREGLCAGTPNEPWHVLGGTQGTEGKPTPCNQSHCFLR